MQDDRAQKRAGGSYDDRRGSRCDPSDKNELAHGTQVPRTEPLGDGNGETSADSYAEAKY